MGKIFNINYVCKNYGIDHKHYDGFIKFNESKPGFKACDILLNRWGYYAKYFLGIRYK